MPMKKTSTPFTLGKRQSLPEELAEVIMRRIEAGDYAPGDVLPSEQALAESFKVSRTVVREALARLKYEGLIASKRGSGPVVRQAEPERGFTLDVEDLSTDELRHFMEFRVIVEGEAAAMAAVRRSEGQLEELRGQLERIRQAVRARKSGTEPDYRFHRLIAEAAGNDYLGDFMKFLSTKIWLGVHRARWHSDRVAGHPEAAFKEHKTMFLAIEGGDPQAARVAAHQHLLRSAGRLGIELDGRFLAGTGGRAGE